MMILRLYGPEDRASVEAWVKEYDQSWSMENVPGLGWVASDSEGDVAVGFLVQTDSGFAVLEGFAAKKGASRERRHEALDALRLQCERTARELGYTRILAYLQHDGLLKRAIDSGYRDVCRCAMIAKEI